MLAQTMSALDVRGGGCYVDLTFGGGGHSRAVLSALSAQQDKGGGRLFSFDRDIDALRNAERDDFWRGEKESGRWKFVHGNFRYMRQFLDYYGVYAYDPQIEGSGVDGVLADLGVSFHHFDEAERGFSFRYEAPLDMRMNREGGQTAADVVNKYDEQRLADIFYLYGELKNGRQLARKIVSSRAAAPILTTTDLLRVAANGHYSTADGITVVDSFLKKDMARLFQALRIEVNDETGALRDMLEAGLAMLRPQGKFVVLTYHSLEDRLVKSFFKAGNAEGTIEKDFYGNIISPFEPKPLYLTASNEEIERNPRSRSAKLRAAVKK